MEETVELRTENSIHFTWESGAEDGGAPILDYRVNSDQGTGTWTVLQSDVTEQFFLATSLSAGTTYQFTVETRTQFGYSEQSDVLSVLCATIPDVPTQPTSTNVNNLVVLDWQAPAANGLEITSYTILIRNGDNLFAENLDYCNGADSAIVASTQCTIPLSSLTADPFNLILGADIELQVEAHNLYGSSGFSTIGSGAVI